MHAHRLGQARMRVDAHMQCFVDDVSGIVLRQSQNS